MVTNTCKHCGQRIEFEHSGWVPAWRHIVSDESATHRATPLLPVEGIDY